MSKIFKMHQARRFLRIHCSSPDRIATSNQQGDNNPSSTIHHTLLHTFLLEFDQLIYLFSRKMLTFLFGGLLNV